MKKFLIALSVCPFLAIAPAIAQWATSASNSTTAAAEINQKTAYQIAATTAPTNCTPGKDWWFDSAASYVPHHCSATNTFANALVVTGGALGTPSSGTLTNVTGLPPAGLAASSWTTLTDGATVTWAIGSVLNAQATLTFTVHSGSRTLNLTGLVNGGFYTAKIIQDSTGGEGLTLGTGCTWKVSGGGGGAVTPSAGANAIDVLSFTYDSGATACYANFNKNFN